MATPQQAPIHSVRFPGLLRRIGRREADASTECISAPRRLNPPFLPIRTYVCTKDPGQDPRHVDMIWPLWNLFDYMPEGRDEKWYPKLSY